VNLWKQAVRLAFQSIADNDVAVVTPEAENVLEWGADVGVLFYDCGTPTRRWVVDEPSQRAVRGWLWRLRHDPVWQRPDPAFCIYRSGKQWNCTIGVLVPSQMSSILNPQDTVEFL